MFPAAYCELNSDLVHILTIYNLILSHLVQLHG
jgi:hypothetical protein